MVHACKQCKCACSVQIELSSALKCAFQQVNLLKYPTLSKYPYSLHTSHLQQRVLIKCANLNIQCNPILYVSITNMLKFRKKLCCIFTFKLHLFIALALCLYTSHLDLIEEVTTLIVGQTLSGPDCIFVRHI